MKIARNRMNEFELFVDMETFLYTWRYPFLLFLFLMNTYPEGVNKSCHRRELLFAAGQV